MVILYNITRFIADIYFGLIKPTKYYNIILCELSNFYILIPVDERLSTNPF